MRCSICAGFCSARRNQDEHSRLQARKRHTRYEALRGRAATGRKRGPQGRREDMEGKALCREERDAAT